MTNEKELDSWLSAEISASRSHLLDVAYRMLSSRAEAEDAVQEAWLRVKRAEVGTLDNPRGWLTTVVARVCLDMLRARKARREGPADPQATEAPSPLASSEPERDMLLADSVGVALMVLLETLSPNERLAFVLHDLFDLPFEEIAEVLGVSVIAARQLASRARRRLQGADVASHEPDGESERHVVQAFLHASRTGDLAGLLAVLHPDVALRVDAFAIAEGQRQKAHGAPDFVPETSGADAVARVFLGRAKAARTALIDGRFGAVWAPEGIARSAFVMTMKGGRIVTIDLIADPSALSKFTIALVSQSE